MGDIVRTEAASVLLIEDLPAKADIYMDLLAEAGINAVYHGEEIESFDQLIEWANRQLDKHKNFVAVVLDLDLRGFRFETHIQRDLDGLEVYCRLKRETRIFDRTGIVILMSQHFAHLRAIREARPGHSQVFILKLFMAAADIPESDVFSLQNPQGFRAVIQRIIEFLDDAR